MRRDDFPIVHLDNDGSWVETGRKLPVNQCDHCHRADWVDERLTMQEAVERGLFQYNAYGTFRLRAPQ